MYDAMISGLNGLGQVANVINDTKKTQSALKLQDQERQINDQVIAKNKETAAQAMQRQMLTDSIEKGGAMSPKAMTAKPGAGEFPMAGGQAAPAGSVVNMDEIKAAKKFDSEAKLWNITNQGREGFQAVTGEMLRKAADERALTSNRADQAGLDKTAQDKKEWSLEQKKGDAQVVKDLAIAESGRFSPVPLSGERLGVMNNKTGTIADSGETRDPKLIGGKTVQEKHEEAVFKAKDKLRDAYEKSGTANSIIMLNDIAGKIGGIDGTGDIPGYGQTGKAPEASLTPEGKEVRTSLAGLRNITLKDRSGAAVTNQEFERLKEEIGGGIWSTDAELRSKLKRMGEIVSQHARNIDATFEGDPDVPREAFEQYRTAGGTTGASLNLLGKKQAGASGKFKILAVDGN